MKMGVDETGHREAALAVDDGAALVTLMRTDDAVADTALMNERLKDYIDGMPQQYYWVHKRFKTRPEGADAVY